VIRTPVCGPRSAVSSRSEHGCHSDGTHTEGTYPLDFYQPGNEDNFTAYTLPNEGTIPQRHISGDVVTVQTYDVGNSIDWVLKYRREARWNVVARALEVMEAGFVKKLNRDGWHVIIAAGLGRGFIGYDNAAAAGQFTKRLISVLKTLMRRNAGGNTSSTNGGRLTDLYISPDALQLLDQSI